MDVKREIRKRNIFMALQIAFLILSAAAIVLLILDKLNSIVYVLIPLWASLLFGALYRNSNKAVKENSDK